MNESCKDCRFFELLEDNRKLCLNKGEPVCEPKLQKLQKKPRKKLKDYLK
jgi:hypothetical protein